MLIAFHQRVFLYFCLLRVRRISRLMVNNKDCDSLIDYWSAQDIWEQNFSQCFELLSSPTSSSPSHLHLLFQFFHCILFLHHLPQFHQLLPLHHPQPLHHLPPLHHAMHLEWLLQAPVPFIFCGLFLPLCCVGLLISLCWGSLSLKSLGTVNHSAPPSVFYNIFSRSTWVYRNPLPSYFPLQPWPGEVRWDEGQSWHGVSGWLCHRPSATLLLKVRFNEV